jgi:hypothetical protein
MLYQDESKSRGRGQATKSARFVSEVTSMRGNLAEWLDADAPYRPKSDPADRDFAMASPPRVRKPWSLMGEEARVF